MEGLLRAVPRVDGAGKGRKGVEKELKQAEGLWKFLDELAESDPEVRSVRTAGWRRLTRAPAGWRAGVQEVRE